MGSRKNNIRFPNKNTAGNGIYGIPDLENNCYGRLDNQLKEAIMKGGFSKTQMRILSFAERKTYGWQKIETYITLSEIERELGIWKSNASRTLKELVNMNVLIVEKQNLLAYDGYVIRKVFRINKRWMEWLPYQTLLNKIKSAVEEEEKKNKNINVDELVIKVINRVYQSDKSGLSKQQIEVIKLITLNKYSIKESSSIDNYSEAVPSETAYEQHSIKEVKDMSNTKENIEELTRAALKESIRAGEKARDEKKLKHQNKQKPQKNEQPTPEWFLWYESWRKWAFNNEYIYKGYELKPLSEIVNVDDGDGNTIKQKRLTGVGHTIRNSILYLTSILYSFHKSKKVPVRFGSIDYIQWLSTYLVGEEGIDANKIFSNPILTFDREFVNLYKEYLILENNSKKGNVADESIITSLDIFYKSNFNPKKYKIEGYKKTIEELKKSVGYPISPWHMHIIIEKISNDSNLSTWDISKAYKWKKEGIFNISIEEALGRKPTRDEQLLSSLITTLQEIRESKDGAFIPVIIKNGEEYNTEQLMKDYGYFDYWKRR